MILFACMCFGFTFFFVLFWLLLLFSFFALSVDLLRLLLLLLLLPMQLFQFNPATFKSCQVFHVFQFVLQFNVLRVIIHFAFFVVVRDNIFFCCHGCLVDNVHRHGCLVDNVHRLGCVFQFFLQFNILLVIIHFAFLFVVRDNIFFCSLGCLVDNVHRHGCLVDNAHSLGCLVDNAHNLGSLFDGCVLVSLVLLVFLVFLVLLFFLFFSRFLLFVHADALFFFEHKQTLQPSRI